MPVSIDAAGLMWQCAFKSKAEYLNGNMVPARLFQKSAVLSSLCCSGSGMSASSLTAPIPRKRKTSMHVAVAAAVVESLLSKNKNQHNLIRNQQRQQHSCSSVTCWGLYLGNSPYYSHIVDCCGFLLASYILVVTSLQTMVLRLSCFVTK